MTGRRQLQLGISCFAACLALSFGITSVLAEQPPRIAFRQHAFRTSRSVRVAGAVIARVRARTGGGVVQVQWYDSDLLLAAPMTGVYAGLYVDGRLLASTLTGRPPGSEEAHQSALLWAGIVPAGDHLFTIRLNRVDRGAFAPYVPPGTTGVDSLAVTQ